MFAVYIEDKHHMSPLMPSYGGFEEEGHLKSLLQVRREPAGNGGDTSHAFTPSALSHLSQGRGRERRLTGPSAPPHTPTGTHCCSIRIQHCAGTWVLATAQEHSAKFCCRGVVRKEVYGRGHRRANSGPLHSSQGTLQKSCLDYNSS